ncbi:Checkpoint kinase 2, partial [Nowakowskiella sp. JEL0078]
QILQGKYTFHDDWWKDTSEEAKDLIRKMLTVDPKLRITATEALTHPWFTLPEDNRPRTAMVKNLVRTMSRAATVIVQQQQFVLTDTNSDEIMGSSSTLSESIESRKSNLQTSETPETETYINIDELETSSAPPVISTRPKRNQQQESNENMSEKMTEQNLKKPRMQTKSQSTKY